MTKAIFTTRVSPSYDDLPEQRYHFPQTYLNRVRSALGDDVMYYEPGRSDAVGSARKGRQAYFAFAHVEGVIDDVQRPGHCYALMSGYLSFDHAVPFARGPDTFESALRKGDGSLNKGAFRHARIR
jgi:putative restriction endonuclease